MRLWPLLLVATTASSVAAPPPSSPARGRVIKIERRRETSVPRMCIISRETEAFCMGQPETNERMVLIDTQGGGVLAEATIKEVHEDKTLGVCSPGGKPYLYRVVLERVSGSLGAHRTGSVVGVRGMRLDSRTQALKNQPSPGGEPTHEQVSLALDTDGDSTADVVVTSYSCDKSGGTSAIDRTMCVDTYLRQSSKRLERVHQERLEPCR